MTIRKPMVDRYARVRVRTTFSPGKTSAMQYNRSSNCMSNPGSDAERAEQRGHLTRPSAAGHHNNPFARARYTQGRSTKPAVVRTTAAAGKNRQPDRSTDPADCAHCHGCERIHDSGIFVADYARRENVAIDSVLRDRRWRYALTSRIRIGSHKLSEISTCTCSARARTRTSTQNSAPSPCMIAGVPRHTFCCLGAERVARQRRRRFQ